jgi:hypothetical protein
MMPRFTSNTQALLDEVDLELYQRTEKNQSWGIDGYANWGLDQDTGLLTFTNEDGAGIGAPAQVAGTLRLRDSSWLWGWANHSIDDTLKVAAKQTLTRIEANGLTDIVEPRLANVTEDHAWQLTALTGYTWGATGTYRGPSGPFHVFIVYGELRSFP